MRRLAAVAVTALTLACAGRGSAPSAAVPPPPPASRAEFAPLPWDQLPRLHRAHDGGSGGKPVCQACHAPDGALAGGAIDACRRCHGFGHSNHPVDVMQKAPAPGLPLVAGGKVVCHTCHDPHAPGMKRTGLRKEFNALCLTCHTKH